MARPKVNEQTAYQMAFEPLILKELIIDCGISQTRLGTAANLSRASINLTLNRGYIPVERTDFKAIIENELMQNRNAVQWLADRKMEMADIWQPLGKDLRKISPAGRGQKVWNLIALRQGMTLLSAEKSGKAFETFMADELDGPLDPENAVNFISMYRAFMKFGKFSDGYFISHKPECRSLADHVLMFEAGKNPVWQ